MYALKNAKDISALKAVSQNLIHENLSITDGAYGILLEGDVKKEILALVKSATEGLENKFDQLVELLIE